ncbi:uncharacterized protein LOC135204539 [Macrobrachium nipponense]|uniref:uncharacterized protein LOC135204539 n=1 Tax=Macrobrachium nipponense TaxID=159736 RepID=UPI0030C86E7C
MISYEGRGKLTVESTSTKETEILKALPHLGGVKVECAVHAFWNYSKGMIYAPQLMTYSEKNLVEELKDQGVIRIERMKKRVNGVFVPLPNLIITFNSTRLPSIVKAAWLRFKIKQYIPRPRRCFHCQEFGHMLESCRQRLKGKPATCVKCSEPDHGMCGKQARCIHCGDNHPSSSLNCDVYIIEKEIQTLRVTERIAVLLQIEEETQMLPRII